MKKTFSTVAIFVIACVMSFAAEAAPTRSPRINQRQTHQQVRIREGVKSDELTRKETLKLEAGQIRVNRMERRAKADGRLTKRERARVHHAQNVQSRQIYTEKHDTQRR